MALMTSSDLKKVSSQGTSILREFIAPGLGGIAGLVGPDFLGVKSLIGNLYDDIAGGANLPSFLGKIDLAGFLAAGVWVGIGALMSRFKFKGALGAIPIGLMWYSYASGARLALDAMIGSISKGVA